MPDSSCVKTIYGTFTSHSKPRLTLTYEYEHSALIAFAKAAELLGATYFFDIGANIGCYSIFLSSIESIEKIVAFEPAPAAYQELTQNIALQTNSEKFSSYAVALSDVKKQAQFLIISPMSGANRLEEGDSQGETIEVSCEMLDAVTQIKNQKIAVKIDVEGHELQTISGMTELLKNNQCLLQVECLEEDLVLRLKKVLRALGYVLVFALRDDYIFLSMSLAESKDLLQHIYFQAVKYDLRDLLALRRYKRKSFDAFVTLLADNDFPYDPVQQ